MSTGRGAEFTQNSLVMNGCRLCCRQYSQLEYHHDNGELSIANKEIAGMGIRKVRTENLPPEVEEWNICDVFSQYGDVKRITDETWFRLYRYQVANGVHVMEISLKTHTVTNANNRQ